MNPLNTFLEATKMMEHFFSVELFLCSTKFLLVVIYKVSYMKLVVKACHLIILSFS